MGFRQAFMLTKTQVVKGSTCILFTIEASSQGKYYNSPELIPPFIQPHVAKYDKNNHTFILKCRRSL